MKSTEFLIEEAIVEAKARGIKIIRRAVFDWVEWIEYPYDFKKAKVPVACNAIGAVLLKMGKEDLVSYNFQPDWLDEVCSYLGTNKNWLWRFSKGFDNSNCLINLSIKNKNDKKVKDLVSNYGNSLAEKVKDENR